VAGYFTKENIMKFNQILITFLLITLSSYAQENQKYWEYLSKPSGGWIDSHTISSNDNILIISENGIFETSISDQFWNHLLIGYNIRDFVLDHKDRIFLIVEIKKYRYEIFISEDNGLTWNSTDNIWNDQITPIKVTVDNKGNVFVLTYKNNDCSIYLSDDHGKNWKEFDAEFDKVGLKKWSIRNIFINSLEQLVISGYNIENDIYENFFCIYDFNTHEWSRFNATIDNHIYNINYISKDSVYLSTIKSLLLSEDGGFSWKIVINKCSNNMIINNDEFYISSQYNGVYYSSNKGKSWEQRNNGIENAFISKVSLIHDSILVATGYPGCYISTDKGKSWLEANEGFTSFDIKDMTFDKEGNLLAIESNYLFKSSDNGGTWTKKYLNGNSHQSILVTKDNSIIIGAFEEDNIKTSHDGGNTWNETPTWSQMINFVYQAKSGRIFAGGYKIQYSDDDGDTWQTAFNYGTVYGMAENNEGHLFVSGERGLILRSTDIGESFEVIQDEISGEYYDSGNIMFYKTKPIGFLSYCEYNTYNNGKSWNKLDLETCSLELALDSLDNMYYCGYGSVRKSTDAFQTSEELPTDGLYHEYFNDIEVSPDGYIFLAAEYGGIYRSRDKFVSVKETPEFPNQIILEQNIPNPFGDETEISFILPEECYVKANSYQYTWTDIICSR
jgi:photosystem II stability/assembly factor-like uncharacterized protein